MSFRVLLDDKRLPEAAPEISVIIPCHNASETIVSQLEAVCSQATDFLEFEVVAVENGSRDGTADVIEDWYERSSAREGFAQRVSRFRVVSLRGSSGAAAARNVGANVATADKLALVDADDVVGDGWLRGMSAHLDRSEIVAGRLEWMVLNDPSLTAFRNHQQADGPVRFAGRPVAISANLGVKEEVWRTLGGMDEKLTAISSGEDVDFCLRASRLGIEVAFGPSAVVHYRLRSGYRATFKQGQKYGRSSCYLYLKYTDRKTWRKIRIGQVARVARLIFQIGTKRGRYELALAAGKAVGGSSTVARRLAREALANPMNSRIDMPYDT